MLTFTLEYFATFLGMAIIISWKRWDLACISRNFNDYVLMARNILLTADYLCIWLYHSLLGTHHIFFYNAILQTTVFTNQSFNGNEERMNTDFSPQRLSVSLRLQNFISHEGSWCWLKKKSIIPNAKERWTRQETTKMTKKPLLWVGRYIWNVSAVLLFS